MSATLTRAEAEDLLYREALLIDTQRFAEWLELFTPDVEFWMPAWRDEATTTEDPDRELSLIYYKGRRNLEDRVMRLTSGLSTASSPLPRVVHQVTNVMVLEADEVAASVSAVWAEIRRAAAWSVQVRRATVVASFMRRGSPFAYRHAMAMYLL